MQKWRKGKRWANMAIWRGARAYGVPDQMVRNPQGHLQARDPGVTTRSMQTRRRELVATAHTGFAARRRVLQARSSLYKSIMVRLRAHQRLQMCPEHGILPTPAL